jgi:aspartate/methionine/tyrosine aminotransferase
MAERCVTVGSSAKELRMIGWRVGWIVAPEDLVPDIAAVSLGNVVVPVGIAQEAVAVALERSHETLPAYIGELERRRDKLMAELSGLPFGVPAGGWSLLLRVSDFGIDGDETSRRLLARKVAATSMAGWGEKGAASYIRFVFSNEKVERLEGLGKKVRKALQSA